MRKVSRLPVVVCWLFEWGLWLVFTDNVGYRELLAGAGAATIATYFSLAFASRKPIDSFQVPRGLSVIWDVPAALAQDTAVLLLAVARRLAGKRIHSGMVAIPFGAVGDNPSSRGKRALATTLMTITPNTLVLGILRDERILYFHRLVPQPPSRLARRLSDRTGRFA